jgi:hypothetical protein
MLFSRKGDDLKKSFALFLFFAFSFSLAAEAYPFPGFFNAFALGPCSGSVSLDNYNDCQVSDLACRVDYVFGIGIINNKDLAVYLTFNPYIQGSISGDRYEIDSTAIFAYSEGIVCFAQSGLLMELNFPLIWDTLQAFIQYDNIAGGSSTSSIFEIPSVNFSIGYWWKRGEKGIAFGKAGLAIVNNLAYTLTPSLAIGVSF